ncbi:rhodanese-like domain-containing protein [Clostridium sp.]|uniref:rhodanese-like domain-containing protein n=1 Tax=Clostridium sp. TaxID=1506 RepID=UPI001A5D0F9B|nr:rhodanese-like domain-containing protein [Clostridium sp.]MBK5235629.1 rhodanese-like domain-containing protein [Clostridium sp.]
MFNSNIKNVSAEEAYKLINNDSEFIILDVRTKEEYDGGHIPGAKLIPVQVLPMMIAELSKYKDKPVLVYCASGGRSPRAVDTLLNNSFKNIFHLSRGISSWRYNVAM